MISKIVLGNGEEILEVEDIQETLQSEGIFKRMGITIILKNLEGDQNLVNMENMFNNYEALSNIKVYKKDSVERIFNEESGSWEETFGEEYLAESYVDYLGLSNVYRNVNSNRLTIQLSSDASILADKRALELENTIKELRELLEQTQEALDFLILYGEVI